MDQEEGCVSIRVNARLSPFGINSFLVRTCTVFFPVLERFWLSCPSVYNPSFCSFPSFLMARASDGTDVPVSLMLCTFSNYCSPDGSGSNFDGQGYRSMHSAKRSVTSCHHSRVDWQILTTTSRPFVKPWV